MTTQHKNARQHSDQMHCSHCGKQWDVNDPEPPACTALNVSAARGQLNRMRIAIRKAAK